MKRIWIIGISACWVASCGAAPDPPPASQEIGSEENAVPTEAVRQAMERELDRINAEASRIDSIFQPLPLLQPGEEEALRRFGNNEQLARARMLGIARMLPAERLEGLRTQGELVLLRDTDRWVVRDLDYSQPLAVPGVGELLTEIGERFSARLAALGSPAFRLEVTSVLRTAEDQAALRQVNPNAAMGESTHEYGTTVDILYSAFTAPASPIVEIDIPEASFLTPHLHQYAAIAAERVAGRRSHELKAILGKVLIEMQNEGRVMVTLERLQPVYHLTLARRN